jgi:hypothetical protein
MAKVTIKMPDEVIARFSKLGENTDRIIDSCLEAGGEVALGYVRDGLAGVVGRDTKFPSRSTGELQQALGLTKPRLNRRGARDVKVGFHEPRSDGRPNALVANVLEYGKSGQPPKPFLKQARSSASKPVTAAIEAQFEEEVAKL